MEHQNTNILEAALLYHNEGLSIIPIGANKRPLLPEWKTYQERIATKEEIEKWFAQSNAVAIGLITGKLSGVIGLDFDIKHGRTSREFSMPVTVCSKTGGGGEHFFFKHPGGYIESTNGVLFGAGIDLKADGGYLILPPSLHASGEKYEWLVPFERDVLADVPTWLTEKISSKENAVTDWAELTRSIVEEGSRHTTHTKLIGKILHQLSPDMWETVGWPAVQAWNQDHAKPPTEVKELRNTWDSLKKKELAKNQKKENKIEQAINIIESDPSVELFADQYGDAYIKILVNDHYQIFACDSSAFKNLFGMRYWEKYGQAPTDEIFKGILNILGGRARFASPKHQLENRVTWHDEHLWYDLSNESWCAVKINKDGWCIEKNPPIIFRRYQHQENQVNPIAGGDVKSFLKFVNIHDDKQKLLLLVFIVSCFIPDIAHVIPVIYGSQGSAKSMLSKLLRRTIDPSMIEVTSFPSKNDDIVEALSHHWFLFFDNVSFISENQSDLLCKVVTGSGFTKRKLYTNNEATIYNFRRVVGINGINLVTNRPDLLERSLLIELDRIPEEKRRQEKEVMEEFKKELPKMLGGIFDTLAKAIKIYPTVKVEKLPRMADFATWGCAIAVALGYSQEDFLEAYRENIKEQNEEAIEQDIVAVAIREFMFDRDSWSGTPSDLLKALTDRRADFGFSKYWPTAPNRLSQKINTLQTNLQAEGIVCKSFRSDGERLIKITKLGVSDDGDDSSQKKLPDLNVE